MADENEWQFLGSDDNSGGADTSLDVSGMTVKKLLQIIDFDETSGGGIRRMRFNSDSGSLYADRSSANGGTDSTRTSQSYYDYSRSVDTTPEFSITDVVNINGEEKLMISHSVAQSTVGASNAPQRKESVGKYVPSPLTDDIDEVNISENSSNNLTTISSIDVAGAD